MKNKIPDFAYHMTKFFTEYLPIRKRSIGGTLVDLPIFLDN